MKQTIKYLVMGMTRWAWQDTLISLTKIHRDQVLMTKSLFDHYVKVSENQAQSLVDRIGDLTEALEDTLVTAESLNADLTAHEGPRGIFRGEPASFRKARAALAKAKGEAP